MPLVNVFPWHTAQSASNAVFPAAACAAVYCGAGPVAAGVGLATEVVVGGTWPIVAVEVRNSAGQRIDAGAEMDVTLEVSTGTGTLAIWTKESESAADVTGVDIDRSILARAARKATRAGANVRFDHARSDSLPYLDASFDRVLSSLFFHPLAWPDKVRTAREAFRVLTPGGELHVADWGRPENALMRTLFLAVQCLDGFENTRDNVAGRLVSLFEEAGFSGVRESQTFSTMLGTIALYRAVKPVSPSA